MQIIIETPRLIIREFLAEEEPLFLNHFDDEELLRYIPKRTREERIAIFQKTITVYDDITTTRIWGIFDKQNGDMAGTCLLRPFNNEPAITELGYSIGKKYWGQGIGTEMATAMADYAFERMSVEKVVAVTIPENTGSNKVLLKSGFTQKENMTRDGIEFAYFERER